MFMQVVAGSVRGSDCKCKNFVHTGNKSGVRQVLRVDRVKEKLIRDQLARCFKKQSGRTRRSIKLKLHGGADLICQQALELIHPYLDRQQDQIQARELEQHLEACEDCDLEYRRQLGLHSALRDASFHYRAPEDFKNRLRSLLAEDPHTTNSSEDTSLQYFETESARRLRARARRDITVPKGI